MNRQMTEKWALLASYALLVASVATIGWIVEHNTTQTQQHQCAVLAAQIRVNVELSLYARALAEGETDIDGLRPTPAGQKIAKDIRDVYVEVCDAPFPEQQ